VFAVSSEYLLCGPTIYGVPQGSILGPLLFSIYVNDLHNVVKFCELNLYAGDMELHCSSVDLFCMEGDQQWDLLSVNCGSVNL